MNQYYWSKSTTSTDAAATHTRHLFSFNAQAGQRTRAACGRHARPVGAQEQDPPASMRCSRCSGTLRAASWRSQQ